MKGNKIVKELVERGLQCPIAFNGFLAWDGLPHCWDVFIVRGGVLIYIVDMWTKRDHRDGSWLCVIRVG